MMVPAGSIVARLTVAAAFWASVPVNCVAGLVRTRMIWPACTGYSLGASILNVPGEATGGMSTCPSVGVVWPSSRKVVIWNGRPETEFGVSRSGSPGRSMKPPWVSPVPLGSPDGTGATALSNGDWKKPIGATPREGFYSTSRLPRTVPAAPAAEARVVAERRVGHLEEIGVVRPGEHAQALPRDGIEGLLVLVVVAQVELVGGQLEFLLQLIGEREVEVRVLVVGGPRPAGGTRKRPGFEDVGTRLEEAEERVGVGEEHRPTHRVVLER